MIEETLIAALALVVVLAPAVLLVALGLPSLVGRPLGETRTGRAARWSVTLALLAAVGVFVGMLATGSRHVPLDLGKWVAVGSKAVTVPAVAGATGKTGPVYGAYDVARGGKGTITVSGWAIDPDTVNPVTYRIDVDGKTVHTALASGTRKDVERAHPGYGSDVGLSVTLTGQKAGRHTVALWFRDLPSGAWKQVGSKTATVS